LKDQLQSKLDKPDSDSLLKPKILAEKQRKH